MKIISGIYKGRNIIGYDIEGTRPTQDRVRESLFGMIQSYLIDSDILDLFAGTGSLGLESLSNGAISVTFVDKNPKCTNNIKKTIELFQVKEETTILNLDYKKALEHLKNKNKSFDIIFLDPPYRYQNIEELLTKIDEMNLIKEDGIVVCEYENDELKEEYPSYKKIKEKKYGFKTISIYKYKR